MNAKIIEGLKAGAGEIRDRQEASAGDREGAYFIDRAIEHLAGADKKRASAAKAEKAAAPATQK